MASPPAPQKIDENIHENIDETIDESTGKHVSDNVAVNAADSADAQPESRKKATPPRVSNRRFDTEKVERIKSEIANGRYEINYLQVADKFIEHERYA